MTEHMQQEQPDKHSETRGEAQKRSTNIVAFRCPPELKKALRVRAIEQDSSIEEIMVELLRREFGASKAGA